MKVTLVCLFILVASFFVTPESVLAQATSARPTSEQSLQDLVKEVRQLRSELRRINAAMYKGQVMIERLKLQQEQVTRLSRELAQVRESLIELRGHQVKFKELLTRTEAGIESGVKDPREVIEMKAELENINLREQRLSLRETQLTNELELERAKLNDLNDRLNVFELELAPK